jgi:hypothetical protein
VEFMERLKACSQALGDHEDFFLQEMRILNFDPTSTPDTKRQRFADLISRFKSGKLGQMQDQSSSSLIGTDLLFAVGNYSHERIQVNHYNTLDFQIHSKLPQDLEVQSVQLVFSSLKQQLNYKLDGPLVLKKGEPIKLTRELFISFNV